MLKTNYALLLAFMAIGGCKTAVLTGSHAETARIGPASAVTTYPAPAALPAGYRSSVFSVAVAGTPVDLYHAGNNGWGQPVSYGYFDLAEPASVSVSPGFAFSSAKVVPESLGIMPTVSGGTVMFDLPGPCDASLVFDNDYQGRTLHLFARAPETAIPEATDPDVIYIAPGYHDYSSGPPISINSGQTLYLAGGAVLRGRLRADGANNVTIRGRGILLNDYHSSDGFDDIALALGGVSHSTVRDIIVNRNANSWTSSMHGCSNIAVTHYRAVSPWFASTDGFNINSSHDITFDSVFIRSADDAIAIKGLSSAPSPAAAAPVYNITYRNSQLWADANNAIGIGAETEAAYFRNIKFQRIDILYSFDDKNHPDVLPDRSAINIFALQGTYFNDILFEDIRVEQAKRLINVHMDETFYFGAITGDWSWPGAMYDITYRNITSTSAGSNEIKLQAWDYQHPIYNVRFENISINGNQVTSFSDPHFRVNQPVYGLSIEHAGGTTSGDRYHAAEDLGTAQGQRNWFCRFWMAGVGTAPMAWNPDASHHWRGSNPYDAIWQAGGEVYLHPDQSQAMLEWQATHGGTVSIQATARKGAVGGGDGVNISIWKNNDSIWPSGGGWHTIAFDDAVGIDQDFSVAVQAGDIISFRVDQRANSAHDTTQWTPLINYQ